MTSTPRQKQLAYIAWLCVCVIWGTTYLGIRVSLETMPPALMGGIRWLIAGGLLTAYVALSGGRLPGTARWPSILLLGLLLLGLGNGGVVYAEQYVPSGLAAVMVATAPFWMSSVEALLPTGERLTRNAVIGLLIGFAGILILVWPDLTTSGGDRRFVGGIVALQIASLGWALGSSYSKRTNRGDDVLGTTALQMLAGGLIMTLFGTFRGEWAQLSFSDRSGAALLYLSTIGSIGGFVAYTFALRHLTVSFVSLYAYINPIIAVALGVLLGGERFDSRMATAALLVLAGVAFVRWAPVRREAAPAPAPATPATTRRIA